MKIRKPSNQVNHEKTLRAIANQGCDVCPNCGEKRPFNINWETMQPYGIAGGVIENFSTGFFNLKIWQKDIYTCYTCGTEYESEPYQI